MEGTISRGMSVILLTMGLITSAAHAQTVEYVHTDALGSVVAITDSAGQVTERREYEPYGSQLTPVIENGPGYTGHVQDAETGLTYMQQRYYDPVLGLFLSIDPVTANEQPITGFNRYRYANNNPYVFVDPDGREVRYADGSSSDFLRNAAKAIRYLNKSGAADPIGKVHMRSEIVTLQAASDRTNAALTNFDPNTGIITWADKGGIEVDNYRTGNSEKMSPALGLGHEFEHAINKLEAPKSFNLDVNTPDPTYNTQEERNVIEQYERPAAEKLGEGQRGNHSGRTVEFKCSTPKCN